MPAPKRKFMKKTVFVLSGTRHTSKEIVTSEAINFAFINKCLNDGKLELIISNPTWECFIDKENKLKPELMENEGISVLLSHMSGFSGMIYGPGVIVFHNSNSHLLNATRKWFRLYVANSQDLYCQDSFDSTMSKIK